MKKTVKLTALLLSMALYLTACDNNNASAPHIHDWGDWEVTTKPTASKAGEETRECKLDTSHIETREVSKLKSYTVTFDSNGGDDVDDQTVTQGVKVSKPSDPEKGEGLAFGGWYKDAGFTKTWDFDDPVTKNITLYAKWDLTYKLGDRGQGGGTIFYRSDEGFTLYADAEDTAGTTAYYLEVAPAKMKTTLAWASTEKGSTNIAGTEAAIGMGKKNTAIILAADAAAPAAKACVEYKSDNFNTKTDWFLPSFDELKELYAITSLGGFATGGDYFWSSTQHTDPTKTNLAYVEDLGVGVNGGDAKTNSRYVRAIRAF
jgi:uncharacterized repeat protein (TIGR02543 family)